MPYAARKRSHPGSARTSARKAGTPEPKCANSTRPATTATRAGVPPLLMTCCNTLSRDPFRAEHCLGHTSMCVVVLVRGCTHAGDLRRLQHFAPDVVIPKSDKKRLDVIGEFRRHAALHRPRQEQQRFRCGEDLDLLGIDR